VLLYDRVLTFIEVPASGSKRFLLTEPFRLHAVAEVLDLGLYVPGLELDFCFLGSYFAVCLFECVFVA
jgi:hypothetical protein